MDRHERFAMACREKHDTSASRGKRVRRGSRLEQFDGALPGRTFHDWRGYLHGLAGIDGSSTSIRWSVQLGDAGQNIVLRGRAGSELDDRGFRADLDVHVDGGERFLVAARQEHRTDASGRKRIGSRSSRDQYDARIPSRTNHDWRTGVYGLAGAMTGSVLRRP